MGEGVDKNLVENPDNKAALTTEGEIGAALNAVTIEPEGDRAMEMEGNIELVTIESSPKWGGTVIEEERPKEQENARTGDIPSTLAMNPDILAPQKKRKRSIDEIKITPPIRRKRTRSAAAAEATRKRWVTLEAQIEFPILEPRPADAPQGLVEEEPQIKGILFENTLLKEEFQTLRRELET